MPTCPNCGHRYRSKGTAEEFLPASPGEFHRVLLQALYDLGAVGEEKGVTMAAVWERAKEWAKKSGRPYPKSHLVTSRLSELRGLRLADWAYGQVRVSFGNDFRYEPKPLWFLTGVGIFSVDGRQVDLTPQSALTGEEFVPDSFPGET